MTIHDTKHSSLTGLASRKTRNGAAQAAALVWRESAFGLQVLLVTSLTSGRWVLPKGWTENGESMAATAAREALEEAGVTGKVSPSPLGAYAYAKRRKSGKIDPVEAEVYLIAAEASAENWPEQHRRRRVWASPEAAATMVEEPDLAAIIHDFGKSRPQRR